MKNLRFLSVLILLTLPLMVSAQETAGLFGKISGWLQGGAVTLAIAFVGGILAKHGWTLIIKQIAKKGAVISKELGDLFYASEGALDKLDNAIKEDGTIDQNSVTEAVAEGKTVFAEFKDVVVSFSPKK